MSAKHGRVTINLTELKAGVVLPADVNDARNTSLLLLSKGTPVTQRFLDRLKDRGVTRVIVDAESAAIIRGGSAPAGSQEKKSATAPKAKPKTPEKKTVTLKRPAVALPTSDVTKKLLDAKETHARHLQGVFESARQNATASTALAKEIVADSVSHIMDDVDAFLKISLQTSENNELYEHCLGVSQLAMSVALTEGMDEDAVHDIGVGCVLSRIGQSDAATQMSEQMRDLSSLEKIDLKRTPGRTFDLLQNMRDISGGARNVAYQIFERFDGSGYPRERAGNQIHPLARMAAVCDVYVALTSPRPHRLPFEPYAAVELLLQETRMGKYDPLAMRALLRTIGLFPIGSFVRLSDGMVGQVVRNHNDQYDRPVVHLFLDDQAHCIQSQHRTIDLKVRSDLSIDSAISTEFVQELLIHSVEGEDVDFSEPQDPQLCLAFDD